MGNIKGKKQNSKRRFKALAAILLTGTLITGGWGSAPFTVPAAEELLEESISADNISANNIPSNNIPADNNSANTIPADTIPANDISDMEQEPVFLSEDQRNTAKTLNEELDLLRDRSSDEDYLEGSAMFLAGSLEEAERVASQYGAELSVFSEGVALISFKDRGIEEALSSVTEDMERVLMAEEEIKADTAGADGIGLSPDRAGEMYEAIADIDVSGLPEVPVYPNYLSDLDVYPEDDPLYGTSNIPPTGQWFHKAINTKDAWALGADGRGTRVAVIDSGIDTSNNDLNCEAALYVEDSAFKKIPKYADLIYNTGEDENGHGTHLAGIIAGLDNTTGGIGVAPEAKIISIRASSSQGKLADSDIAIAIQMAIDNKVDVINLSFSGGHYNEAINEKIRAAIRAGIVCVASAGNESADEPAYPASYDGVISVGSYAEDGSLSSFSNYGSSVMLAAPGSDIMSTMVVNPSAYMRRQNSFTDTYSNECSYGKLSGTSMAAPVVSGVAALVKSVHRDLSVKQITQVIRNSARGEVHRNGSRTVTGGVNAFKAVSMGESGGLSDDPEIVSEDDYLFFGVGDEIRVKAGKSVPLAVCTSIKNTKPVYYVNSGSGMITVNKNGTLAVNKKAALGDTAVITVQCASLTDRVKVTVIDAKSPSQGFGLSAGSMSLSTTEGIGENSTRIFMTGGDTDRPYRLVLTGNGAACFKSGGRELEVFHNYKPEDGNIAEVYAKKSGTATLTAYATDGSGCKTSLKINCVTPLTDVAVTYKNIPVPGRITMSRGSVLSLKAQALNAAGKKAEGKVKYTWSGEHVKNGKVNAPAYKTSFPVTVTAESNGFSAKKTVTVDVSKEAGVIYMGYYYRNSNDSCSYVNSISSKADAEGNAYRVGVSYGLSAMPDLSHVYKKGAATGLKGPFAFTRKGNDPIGYDNSSNESGNYIASVTGPKVDNLVYGNGGVRCFTPGKKGKYKYIFTSLDGSGKTFTININVTEERIPEEEQENDEFKMIGF